MQTSPRRPSAIDLRRLVGSVNQLRFNDSRGELSFYGQKMIILRRDVFRIMREGLERLVGEQAAPFLNYLASGIGVHEGSIFRESAKSNGVNERASLENLVHTAFEDTNLGLGKIKVDKLDLERGTVNVAITNCFEALENGSSEGPNCMFTSGFLAGLFAEVFDKTVQANEVHCMSQGNSECQFQVSPAEIAFEPDSNAAGGMEAYPAPQGPPAPGAETPAEGSKDSKPDAGSKPVAVESSSKAKDARTGGSERGSYPQPDLDAGVERAARIAKRKQGFWEKLFRK